MFNLIDCIVTYQHVKIELLHVSMLSVNNDRQHAEKLDLFEIKIDGNLWWLKLKKFNKIKFKLPTIIESYYTFRAIKNE